MIKISVIIPVYNTESYIEDCLESILSQTLKEIEIICIDDGSTDHSYDILGKYSDKYKNIIVLHQKNMGASIARNQGIKCANGKYICFMDSDDYYIQNHALEILYLEAEKNHVSVCGGDLALVSGDGGIKKVEKNLPRNEIVEFKDFGEYYYYTSYIFNTEFVRKNKILFPPYRRYEDPLFLLKVMICAQKFFYVNKMIYAYRLKDKVEKYSFNTAIDILVGIRDCFKLAKENELSITYDLHLKNALYSNLGIFYLYAHEGKREIWELINEVNVINKEWKGESCTVFQDKESLEAYILEIKSTWKQFMDACHSEEVVIYGAGEVAQYFVKNYGKQCKCIKGFAVSKKCGRDMLEGYAIKEIHSYNKESMVIVATGKSYAEEILKNLEELQFKNVLVLDFHTMKVMNNIQNNEYKRL